MKNRQVFLMDILVNVEPDEAQACIGKTTNNKPRPPIQLREREWPALLCTELGKRTAQNATLKRVEKHRTSRENQSRLRVTSGHTFDISLLFLSVLFRQRV